MAYPALDEPNGWSVPLGSLLGVRIRVHALFLVVAIGLVVRAAVASPGEPDIWLSALAIQVLLFASVFIHEWAHVFAARLLGHDPAQMLLWPLGGLISHEPGEESAVRPRLAVAAAGPLANLVICLICAAVLLAAGRTPPLDLFWDPLGGPSGVAAPVRFLAQLFWVNWILFLCNSFVPALPLDCGEALLAVFSGRAGERAGVVAAVKASLCSLLICVIAAVALNDVLGLVLALVIWISARQRMLRMESGETDLFGNPGGYAPSTSLDMVPRQPVRSWWERYRERVSARRLEREAQTRRLDEERMDGLLEKLHRMGRDSLSKEERGFMELFANRCRERQSEPRG